MIKQLTHFFIRKFESHYDYDATYLHTINEISPSAVRKLMKISGMTGYKGPEPSVWGGAALAATLHSDCGPCAQLVLNMVQEAGLDSAELQACVREEWVKAGATGLGFKFAHAVLNNHPSVDSLSDQIINQFGKNALVAAAFATVSYPVYPLLKRAFGEAKSCEALRFDEETNIAVNSEKL